MKKKITLIVKITVSLGLIVYALRSVDIFAILKAMESAIFYFILIALLLIAIGFIISALRWQILLKAQHIDISKFQLIKYYLVGSFFNNFLPTTIGGDIMRTYDVSKTSKSLAQSFAVIIVERLSGLFAMITYAFAGLVLSYQTFGNFTLVWLAGGIFILIVITIILGAYLYGGKRIQVENGGLGEKIKIKINQLFNSLKLYKGKKKNFCTPFFWRSCFNLM